MAIEILRAMSWECGDSMVASSDKNSGFSAANAPHTGTYSAMAGPGSNSWGRFLIDGTPANPSISVWVAPDAYHYSQDNLLRIYFQLNTGQTIELRWNATTHTFDAYVNGGLVAAGTVVVSSATWFHVQFYLVVSDAGSIQVKIHGHESINYSGDTKVEAGSTGVDYVYLFGGYSGAGVCFFDDLVIGTGGYLGDLRCVDMMPEADTAQDDWTPSAGDNYSTIDEMIPSDVDYNETNVDAQVDELALTGFDGATYVPVAVTAWVRAREEAATGDSIKVGFNSNGTIDVTERILTTAYEYKFHTNDEDPDGPAAWDDAALEALLLRYESVIS